MVNGRKKQTEEEIFINDTDIIELYFSRNEKAIAESAAKYGNYCTSIAYRILNDRSDAEECVNDAYRSAWNEIPPKRPSALRLFLGRLTRNTALDRYREKRAKKRGGGITALAFEELDSCIPSDFSVEEQTDAISLTDTLNSFLGGLDTKKRVIFIQRYWYFMSVEEISLDSGYSKSDIRTTLFRTREKLREHLEKEGFTV